MPLGCLSEIKDKWEDYEVIYKGFPEVKEAPSRPRLFENPLLTCEIVSPKPLKKFQEKYVRLNSEIRKALLAAPTGAGKTLCSTLRYNVLNDKSLLIVCPKILKTNWQENLRIDFNKDSLVYWGPANKRDKLQPQDYEIVITTYEVLPYLKRFDFEHLIVDEAHLLSNPTTSRFKSFKEFYDSLKDLKSLQLLSGTPIQHKPKDLWSLVHLIDPYMAGTYKSWCNEYEEVVKTFRKEIVLKDRTGRIIKDSQGNPKTYIKEVPLITKTKNIDKLREKLSTIMYRVSREDALECKEEQELIYLDMTKAQERLYHSIKNEILVELENKTLALQHAPVRMGRLLQAAEGLFNFDINNLESTKLEYLQYEIDNNVDKNNKLVIWTRFKPLTYILQSLYPDKVAIYNGDISDKAKQLAIWAFNGVDDKEQEELYKRYQEKLEYKFNSGDAPVWIGVIDPKSSLGFNLHRYCNRQIFSSYSFLGSANYQSSSRLVRLGQQSDYVSTQYLVVRNSIEPAALSLITKNFNLATSIIDGEQSLSYKNGKSLLSLLQKEY